MWFRAIFKVFTAVIWLFILAALLFIAGIVWSYYFEVSAVREPFISSEWIKQENPYSESGDPGCVRGGMALDLIKNNLIINRNTEEVIALLGQPSSPSKINFSYELGQCSGLGWESSVLVIEFKNNLVTQLNIVRNVP
jgi:hypothetical protein